MSGAVTAHGPGWYPDAVAAPMRYGRLFLTRNRAANQAGHGRDGNRD
jgi:hypothetical protein